MYYKTGKNLFFIFAFACFFAVISNFTYSQEDDSSWFWGKPIAEISYDGLKSVKKSEVSGVTDVFIGKEFTSELYEQMLDRLYALGYFVEIEPYATRSKRNPNRIHLVFQVKEHPVVLYIEFKGNKKIRTNELRDTVVIKTGDVFQKQNVLLDERSLRDLYISKGYMDASVSHTETELEDGYRITFIINEGEGTVVSSIKFAGNTVFSERTLKSRLKLKEAGFLKDGAFQRSSLETDKQTIIAYYSSKGYIDARIVDVVQDITTNEKKSRDEMSLTFVISEGVQYTFNGLTLSGNEIFSTEKLLSLVKLKNGEVFNQVKFNEGISNLTNLYYENGYMTTELNPLVTKDSERHTISYSITITERSRAHIENIIIKGNTKTKESVILRELPFAPGDVFSRDKILAGMRNLYNTQYFSNAYPEPVSGSEQNLVDLVITVEEQSTTSLLFGMTFAGITDADDFPISLFAKWENSNFRGLGKRISAGTTISSSEQSIDFSFGQSWIFDKPISWTESLSLFHTKSNALAINWLPDGTLGSSYYMNYDSWGTSLNSSLGHRWMPNFAIITAAAGMSNTVTDNIYDESLYTALDPSVAKSANRFGLKDSIYASVSLDNRDINFDPTKGWFVSQRFAWYGLLPGIEHEFYLRLDTKLEGYVKLLDIPLFNNFWNFKLVFAAYTGLTTIFPIQDSMFGDASKVYIDGMINGRGWDSTLLRNTVRGKAMLSNKLELRIPLFQGVIGLAGFFDAAAVKDEPEQIFNSLKLDDFYFSFGPAIRFLIPQFPLHLLFSNKFRVIDGDVHWDDTWHFGLSFNIVNR